MTGHIPLLSGKYKLRVKNEASPTSEEVYIGQQSHVTNYDEDKYERSEMLHNGGIEGDTIDSNRETDFAREVLNMVNLPTSSYITALS